MKLFFYQFTVSVNKCGRSCNTIDDSYDRTRVPDKAKNMTVKVLNLVSGVSKTRFLLQHEPCECKYGLNESACISK